MPSIKTFAVFGDRVDVFVDSSMSNGLYSTLVQEVHPGGGPPPHSHTKEDETFVVLDGDFEFLMDGKWQPLVPGEAAYARRGSIHTFRNSGKAIGRYSPATDMPKIIEISNRYGITFYL